MGPWPTGGICDNSRDCVPGNICFELVCVGEGALRISLAWNTITDLDIHLVTPNGNEIYWANTNADGGMLDLDDCIGGGCANASATHVENINFPDSAPAGLYTVWVENYDGLDSASFTIDVSQGSFFSGSVAPISGEVSEFFDFTY